MPAYCIPMAFSSTCLRPYAPFPYQQGVRSFVSVEERNEPYIDGGLFAMAFLTALECESLAACPLNTMMREKQEHEIRKLLGVPDYETLIAFVAIGNFPESIESPVSFRYDASAITRELN